MQAALGGGIMPTVVYKSGDGKPCIPVILSGQGVKAKVLLHPLILSLCESIGLWVECSANILSYPQFGGKGS